MSDDKKTIKAVVVKKSIWQRFRAAIFVSKPGEIKDYIIDNVLIPNTIDLLADIAYGTIDAALYGKSSRRRGRRRGKETTHSVIDFTNPDRDRIVDTRRSGDIFDFGSVFFPDKQSADEAFDLLQEELENNGEVTCYYFCDIAEITPPHTLQNWGWKTLEGTGYNRGPEGVALVLPKPVLLKK